MNFKEKIKKNANKILEIIYSRLNYRDVFLAFDPYHYHLYICNYLDIDVEDTFESNYIPQYYNWASKYSDCSKKYTYTGYKRDETVLGIVQLFTHMGSIYHKSKEFENRIFYELKLISRLQEEDVIEAVNDLREGIVEMMNSMDLDRDTTSWVILFDPLPSERHTPPIPEMKIRFIPRQPQSETIELK